MYDEAPRSKGCEADALDWLPVGRGKPRRVLWRWIVEQRHDGEPSYLAEVKGKYLFFRKLGSLRLRRGIRQGQVRMPGHRSRSFVQLAYQPRRRRAAWLETCGQFNALLDAAGVKPPANAGQAAALVRRYHEIIGGNNLLGTRFRMIEKLPASRLRHHRSPRKGIGQWFEEHPQIAFRPPTAERTAQGWRHEVFSRHLRSGALRRDLVFLDERGRIRDHQRQILALRVGPLARVD